jgi:hypothetical protein
MEINPEYLAWLEQHGDSLLKNDPRFPRMQPNPEYQRWLAEQERARQEQENEQVTGDLPPVQTGPPVTRTRPNLEQDLAQEEPANLNRPQKDIIIDLAYTATGYYGDLNYSDQGLIGSDFINFYPGLTASLRRDAPRLVLPSFHIGYGRFVAQNPNLTPVSVQVNEIDTLIMPNTYSETDLIHGDFILMFNPVMGNSVIKPYFGLGVGGMAFYPKAKDGILLFRKFSTRAPQERTYGTLAVTVPITAGLHYNINRSLSVHFGYLYRFTSTDYLDNIGMLGGHEGND